MNDVITHLLDPNLYYSRFSFLESGMEAINIKYEVKNNMTPTYLLIEGKDFDVAEDSQ